MHSCIKRGHLGINNSGIAKQLHWGLWSWCSAFVSADLLISAGSARHPSGGVIHVFFSGMLKICMCLMFLLLLSSPFWWFFDCVG